MASALRVTPTTVVIDCRERKDKYLEFALAAEAATIVSGDMICSS